MTDPRQDTVADVETARLIQGGDQEGLRHLFANHGSKIKWYLRKNLGLGDDEIQDALNRAAFRVWRSIASFDPQKGSLPAWFFRIVRNVGLSILKEQARHRSVHAVEDWDAASFLALHQPDPGTDGQDRTEAPTPEQGEFLAAFYECVQKLTTRQRQVILADLQKGEVANAKQLAEDLKTSVNSIYVSRSQARKALREGMQLLGYCLDDSGAHLLEGRSPLTSTSRPKPRKTGDGTAGDP